MNQIQQAQYKIQSREIMKSRTAISKKKQLITIRDKMECNNLRHHNLDKQKINNRLTKISIILKT